MYVYDSQNVLSSLKAHIIKPVLTRISSVIDATKKTPNGKFTMDKGIKRGGVKSFLFFFCIFFLLYFINLCYNFMPNALIMISYIQ